MTNFPSAPRFIIALTGSRFFKAPHYLMVAPGVLASQRSKARATRLNRAEADLIAATWSDPNGFTATVIIA